MKKELLDQYQEWKKRPRTWPPLDIKNYFGEGISIGVKLLWLGCHEDREGLSIRDQIEDMEEQLNEIVKKERGE